MLKFVKGDMFDGAYDIRVNTVNCVGVMGAGVALAFKTRYPEMFRAYKKACNEGRIRPGEVDVWRTVTEWIINFPTKRHWREKSRYEDVDAGLRSLREYLRSQGPVRVALPALGCGHGGLDWPRVAEMIKDKLDGLEAEIHVFEPSDSRTAGEKTEEAQRRREEEAGLVWSDLDASDPEFPLRLREAEINRIFVLGDISLLTARAVAVLGTAQPDAREEAAALACVEALGANVQLSLAFGSRVAHTFAAAHMEKGGRVVLWGAQGKTRIQVPLKFHEEVRGGRLAVVTVAPPSERWTRLNAERTAVVQASAAAVILLSGNLDRLLGQIGSSRRRGPLFYIWYDGTTPSTLSALEAARATRIGRVRETGMPNVRPIISALGDAEQMKSE